MTEQAVLAAARKRFGTRKSLKFRAFFEHGQWWLSLDDERLDTAEGSFTFSVVETSAGLDFEEV